METNISDHGQIFMRKKKDTLKKIKASFRARIYKNYDGTAYADTLRQRNWEDLLKIEDCDKAWEEYLSILERELNKTCPIQNISINQVRAQWLTPDHLEQIKLKDDLLAEARSTRDREIWIAAQKCRNLTKKMMKHAKSKFLTTAWRRVDMTVRDSGGPRRRYYPKGTQNIL